MNAMILFLVWSFLPIPQEQLPGSWLVRFKLAEEALEAGALDEAVELLNSCFELAPKNATTAYHLACTHARAERYDEALAWLERTVDWDWIDVEVMEWDEDLLPLRSGERFQSIAERAGLGRKTSTPEMDSEKGRAKFRVEENVIPMKWQDYLLGQPRVLPDDITVLVPVGDGSIRGFDVGTGRLKWILEGHRGRIEEVDVLSDGTSAASAGLDGTVRIWDLKNLEETAVIEDAYEIKTKYMQPRVRLHPAGDRVATFGYDYPGIVPVRVWSVETGKELFHVPDHEGVRDLTWSPDGALLATGHEDGTARFWNASNGTSVGSTMSHPEAVSSIAFDHSGRRVATGSYQKQAEDPTVLLWDVRSNTLLAELPLSGDFLFSCRVPFLTWTPKGDLVATTCKFRTVECWDGRTLERRWYRDSGGGNPWTFYATTNDSCRRLYAWGMRTVDTHVLDIDTGETLWLLGERDLWGISGTADDRAVIAVVEYGTAVLDGATFIERYRRIELPDGDALLYTPSLIYQGSLSAIRGTSLIDEEESYPLDGFAPILYDPKRFQAAASGVSIRQPLLTDPPRLHSISPDARSVSVEDNTVEVWIRAEGEGGVLSFQLERDGKILPLNPTDVTIQTNSKDAQLIWKLNRSIERETNISIRAIDRSGILSSPARLTIYWR